MTVKSLPRYFPIVAHFAGDSTMTRFFPDFIVGVQTATVLVFVLVLVFAEVFAFALAFAEIVAMSDHKSDKILV